MVAQPIRSTGGVVGIEYGHFYVESRGLREPPRFLFDDDGGFLGAMDDVIALRVASDVTRHALLQVEVWDVPPVTGGPDGARRGERTVRFTEAAVHGRAVSATAPETAVLELGPAGTYHARAFRWGAETAEAVFRANPHAPVHRVESFLLQFWPTAEPDVPVVRAPRSAPGELGAFRDRLDDWLRSRGPDPG
ncbi:hypothetical protein [Saccharothrix stipae]